MRVKKQGEIPPKPWVGEYQCSHCHCVFELDNTDPEPERHATRDERDRPWYEVPCPTCTQPVKKRI